MVIGGCTAKGVVAEPMLAMLPSVCVEVDEEKPDSAEGVGANVACIGTFCTLMFFLPGMWLKIKINSYLKPASCTGITGDRGSVGVSCSTRG